MGATDQMLARYAAEIEERQAFIDGLVTAAGNEDLTPETAELVSEARKRMDKVQTDPTSHVRRHLHHEHVRRWRRNPDRSDGLVRCHRRHHL